MNQLVGITRKLNSFHEYATDELEKNKKELSELRKISKEYGLFNKFLDKNNYRNDFEIYKLRDKKQNQNLER